MITKVFFSNLSGSSDVAPECELLGLAPHPLALNLRLLLDVEGLLADVLSIAFSFLGFSE